MDALIVKRSLVGPVLLAVFRCTPVAAAVPPSQSPSPWVGVSACSARACHGSLQPLGGFAIQQNEYTTWITRDKHSRAYELLLNDRSKSIARNLGVEQATQDGRCLACHTITLPFADHQGLVRDGISCEACHGPARKWLEPHTTARWRSLAAKQKHQAYGMTPVGNLATRAQLCAGCHVGAARDEKASIPERDAHHEIMAAGHPRLTFELGSYLANMPPHWRPKEGKSASEAWIWAMGQAAVTEAALELLRTRAMDSGRPWPEFAEYDCFSCHHALGDGRWWRSPGRLRNRSPGLPPWGNWYRMTQLLAAERPGPGESLIASLDQLQRTMAHPSPNRIEVARQADSALTQLTIWMRSLALSQFDASRIHALLVVLAKDEQDLAGTSWDTAAQLFLALRALREAQRNLPGQRPEPLGKTPVDIELSAMIEKLRFPPGFESPAGYDPEQLRPILRRLQKQLAQ